MTEGAEGGFSAFQPQNGEELVDALLARIKTNFTTAYEKASIETLAKLKTNDLSRYMKVFAELKAIDGISIGTLRQAIEKVERKLSSGGRGEPRTPEDILLSFVGSYSGFCDGDVVYFDVNIDEHRETLRSGDRRLIAHIRSQYLEMTHQSVSADAIKQVVDTVADRIAMHGEQRPVFCRVGADDDGIIFLDLGHAEGTYVRIAPNGWEVCERPALDRDAHPNKDMPVRFARLRNTLPLPLPEPGSIEEFRQFLVQRSGSEADRIAFILIVGWLIGCLNPFGSYPGLGLGGPPGSGKTSTLRIVRRLVDPSRAMARSAPKNERDLMISAKRSFVQSYDNLSKITQELSDAFCRLSTGGGLATRQLYTDDEEMVFEACRPFLIAAIADVVTRPDLADRVISVVLPEREGDDRLPEEEVEANFLAAWPRILGALLTAVAIGLKRSALVAPPADLPRMASFAAWVAACEPGLGWAEGTFLAAYRKSILMMADVVADADPVAAAIVKWVCEFPADKPIWEGSVGDALAELNNIAGHAAASKKGWPGTPQNLSNRFKTVAPTLRRLGIRIEPGRILEGRTQWKAWQEHN